MKAVVYFNAGDVEKAREVLGSLKASGSKAHWAGAEEFQDPRDVERVDEVHLASPAPHIEAAYEKRKIKIKKAFEAEKPKRAPRKAFSPPADDNEAE